MKIILLCFIFILLISSGIAQKLPPIDSTKTIRGGKIPPLPGASREIKKIEKSINRALKRQKKKIQKPDTLYIKTDRIYSSKEDTSKTQVNQNIQFISIPFEKNNNGFSNQKDTTKVNTESVLSDYEVFNLNLSATELAVLSLIDTKEDMLNNWDTYTQSLKQNYQNQAILVAVSKDDNPIRSKFVMKFYEERLKDLDYKTAYQNAVNYLEKNYPNSGIKHFLYLGK